MKLEELNIYNQSLDVGQRIYEQVSEWEWFHKKAIGDQLVRSADSVAANIAEGYGRYYYKENKLFCYYSRGSLMETITWMRKAQDRSLIESEIAGDILKDLQGLLSGLDAYIMSIGSNSRY